MITQGPNRKTFQWPYECSICAVGIYLEKWTNLYKSLFRRYNSYNTAIRPECSICDIRSLGLNKFAVFILMFYLKYILSNNVTQNILYLSVQLLHGNSFNCFTSPFTSGGQNSTTSLCSTISKKILCVQRSIVIFIHLGVLWVLMVETFSDI